MIIWLATSLNHNYLDKSDLQAVEMVLSFTSITITPNFLPSSESYYGIIVSGFDILSTRHISPRVMNEKETIITTKIQTEIFN